MVKTVGGPFPGPKGGVFASSGTIKPTGKGHGGKGDLSLIGALLAGGMKGGGGRKVEITDHNNPGSMVWIRGIPFRTSWQELKDHLGQAGTVEFVKLMTEDGTEWGRKKGTAAARFSTPAEAQKAIRMLNMKDFNGRYLEIDTWTEKPEGERPKRHFNSQQNWGGGLGGLAALMGGGGGGGRKVQISDHNNPGTMVWIRGLPFKCGWQDLKDHLGQAGTVEFVKLFTEDGTEWGRKKGTAAARFSTPAEAKKAITMLNMQDFGGRYLEIDSWTEKQAGISPL